MNASLDEIDPEVADIIELEKARQWKVSTKFSENDQIHIYRSFDLLIWGMMLRVFSGI